MYHWTIGLSQLDHIIAICAKSSVSVEVSIEVILCINIAGFSKTFHTCFILFLNFHMKTSEYVEIAENENQHKGSSHVPQIKCTALYKNLLFFKADQLPSNVWNHVHRWCMQLLIWFSIFRCGSVLNLKVVFRVIYTTGSLFKLFNMGVMH